MSSTINQVEEIANCDPLTGLYNRHFYANYFPDEARQAQRDQKPLSVAVADLDLFKVQNENFGYEGGNAILQQLGPVIREYCLAQAIIPVRHSGDEFVLLMPETAAEDAAALAEDFRRYVESQVYEVMGESTQVTLSVGVATYPTHAPEAFDVYDAAFGAMTLAKRRGRNQVCTPAQEQRVLFTKDNFHRLFPCPRIIGRADVISKIKPFMSLQATVGRPFILLTGDAGVGKTRLMELFQSMVDAKRTVSLYVKAHAHLANQPYGVIIELIRYIIGVHPAWVEPLIEHLTADERRAVAPLIPELIEPELTEYGTVSDPFDVLGDDTRMIITGAFVKLVLALGAGKPLNLFLDDLHWSDAATFEVLENMKYTREGDAALIMVTMRRSGEQICDGSKAVVEFVNTGLKNHWILRWDLDPLSYHNVPEMIDTVIPGLQRYKRVLQIVTGKSHAYPLRVEEVLKFLIQKEYIVSQEGILVVNEFSDDAIPDRFEDIVEARTRELEAEVRELVGRSSVVGTNFGLQALLDVEVGTEGPLLDAIDKGVRICLLKDEGDEFSFVSDSVQTAVYEKVDKPVKVQIHTKIAELEEQRRGDAIDGSVGKLAFHYERAGNLERARGVLTRLEKFEQQVVGDLQAAPPMSALFIAQIGDDIPVLIKDLESGHADKIAYAATALIRKGGFSIKPLLGLISSSQDLRARRVALQCLNRIGTRVLSTLVETLHKTQDFSEKIRLIETLEYYQDDSVPEVLKPFVHYPEETIRREALRVLEKICDDEELTATLMQALQDETLAVRLDAMAALGRMRKVEAIPLLKRIIRKRTIFFLDKKVEEQRHACQALGDIGDLMGLDPLLAVLERSGWWTLMRNKKPEVRAAAAMAIATMRLPGGEPGLRKACSDKNPLIRSAAHTALNVMHDIDEFQVKKTPVFEDEPEAQAADDADASAEEEIKEARMASGAVVGEQTVEEHYRV